MNEIEPLIIRINKKYIIVNTQNCDIHAGLIGEHIIFIFAMLKKFLSMNSSQIILTSYFPFCALYQDFLIFLPKSEKATFLVIQKKKFGILNGSFPNTAALNFLIFPPL
jgi:hypothetical protein